MMGATGKESFDHLLGQGDEYVLGVPDAPVFNLSDPRERDIVNWRAGCFLDAGCELSCATALAVRRDVDTHRVVDMLDAGATSTQVCAILL